MYQITCNLKGSRHMVISEDHLQTIERYSLLSDLLDSNGIVDDNVLEKLRYNVRSLLEGTNYESHLLSFCQEVLLHDNMKSFGLHNLILLYIDWKRDHTSETESNNEDE